MGEKAGTASGEGDLDEDARDDDEGHRTSVQQADAVTGDAADDADEEERAATAAASDNDDGEDGEGVCDEDGERGGLAAEEGGSAREPELKPLTGPELANMLPLVAFEMLSGPWRRTWLRFGYDVTRDPSARFLQALDVHQKRDPRECCLFFVRRVYLRLDLAPFWKKYDWILRPFGKRGRNLSHSKKLDKTASNSALKKERSLKKKRGARRCVCVCMFFDPLLFFEIGSDSLLSSTPHCRCATPRPRSLSSPKRTARTRRSLCPRCAP